MSHTQQGRATGQVFPRRAPSSTGVTLKPTELRCPSDKSLTHRAVIFAAMAKGESRVHAPLLGEDCLTTIQCFRALGVSIDIVRSFEGDDLGFLRINSGGWDSWRSPNQVLDFGNSGTTTRLLLGTFAATPNLDVTVKGDASLSTRPMLRVVEPLRRMGANIESCSGGDGNFLPLRIQGRKLSAATHQVGKASAQIKSALCLAALNCEGESRVTLPHGARTHTELLLARLGAKISTEVQGGNEIISVRGPFRPQAFDWKIPADPSSVAFFAALATLHPDLTLNFTEVLDNPTRTAVLAKLSSAGLSIDVSRDNEPRMCEASMTVLARMQGIPRPFNIAPEEAAGVIDEIPILAVVAALADGRSVFSGLHELRVKESDRLEQTALLLRAAGVECAIADDDLIINGRAVNTVRAFEFDPKWDHRLAMAAAVLASRADGPCTINSPECVLVSFPGFYNFLEKCGINSDINAIDKS